MEPLSRLSVAVVLIQVFCAEAAQWRTLWRDDFNGRSGSQPSQSNWIYDTGTSYPGGPQAWGTGEVQTYTSNVENVRLDGHGNLVITPLRVNGRWTSARIETKRADFKPPRGGKLSMEARIRIPAVTGKKAAGYWPAFWALGAPFRGNYYNWPSVGEFDIMENVNGEDFVKGVLHCGVYGGGPCNEVAGIGHERPCPGSTCQAGFHTYRFEWDESTGPHEFRWYVDGQLYHRVNRNQVGGSTWDQVTGHGYFLLLNVAIGGGFPNHRLGRPTPTSDTEPAHSMQVDYVDVSVYT